MDSFGRVGASVCETCVRFVKNWTFCWLNFWYSSIERLLVIFGESDAEISSIASWNLPTLVFFLKGWAFLEESRCSDFLPELIGRGGLSVSVFSSAVMTSITGTARLGGNWIS